MRRSMNGVMWARVAAAMSCAGCVATASAGPATIWFLRPEGICPTGMGTQLADVSDDGGTVVGWFQCYPRCPGGTTCESAFRWTRASGLEQVDPVPGVRGQPLRVSRDGKTMAGWSGSRTARWTTDGLYEDVGPSVSSLTLSTNGDSVLGWIRGCQRLSCYTSWWWWPRYDGEHLPLQLNRAWMYGMSGDGRVAIGTAIDASQTITLGVVWYADESRLVTIMNPDGSVPASCTPQLVSGDARYVLGLISETRDADARTFVWSAERGTQLLNVTGMVQSMTGDATRLVGTREISVGGGETRQFAFIWGDGVAWDLGSYLISRGARIQVGSRIETAIKITPDGRVVAGNIVLPDGVSVGYVATLGSACTADVDNGLGYGIPDDAVTIEDLMYYLGQYAAGTYEADVDDGSGAGVRDEAVTIEDLLYYLQHYAAGC